MGNTAVRRPASGPALHPSPGSLSEDPVTVQGANTHTGSTRELSSGQCGPQNPRYSAGSELLRALHGACRAPLPTSAPSCRPSWTHCWPLAGVRRRHRQHWQTVSFPPHTCGKKTPSSLESVLDEAVQVTGLGNAPFSNMLCDGAGRGTKRSCGRRAAASCQQPR